MKTFHALAALLIIVAVVLLDWNVWIPGHFEWYSYVAFFGGAAYFVWFLYSVYKQQAK